MKFKIEKYKNNWGIWYNEPNYLEFNPIEIFVKYRQAFLYCRQKQKEYRKWILQKTI